MKAIERNQYLLLCTGAMLFFLASGCGRAPKTNIESNAAAAPVVALADAAENPKHFQALFVAGAVPNEAQRQRFMKLMFQVAAVKTVSDSEATLHVLIDDGHGKSLGETDWTVVREGQQWKLKSAALP
ncbi:MAG TPA: hypothetical protein VGJ15_04390 [Pirellulales bacterium]|jgi:hypothetical protein